MGCHPHLGQLLMRLEDKGELGEELLLLLMQGDPMKLWEGLYGQVLLLLLVEDL